VSAENTNSAVQEAPAQPVQPPPPGISVTPKAVQKIRQTFAKMGVEGGLRLGVLGGGCSGLSYQFKFEPQPRPRDNVYDFEGVHIYIDPKSLLYLHGMTLDYKESLMQSGFVFENPNAKKSCGCGSSFAA
jgi:iron-sulfur cluster assembly protein